MDVCSCPSSEMSPPTFLPGGLHPSFKPQFGLLSFLPPTPGSHFFLTYLHFLQPKHSCYSPPVFFLSIHQDLEQGIAVPKKPLLRLLKPLVSILPVTCSNYACTVYFSTWFQVILYFLCLIFVRQIILTYLREKLHSSLKYVTYC